jgi:hypothetical protein
MGTFVWTTFGVIQFTHNVGVLGSRMIQIKGPGEIRKNFAFDTELLLHGDGVQQKSIILYFIIHLRGKGHFNQYKRFPDIKMIYDFF